MKKVAWCPQTDPEFRLLGIEMFQQAAAVYLPANREIKSDEYFEELAERIQNLIDTADDPQYALETIRHFLRTESIISLYNRASRVEIAGRELAVEDMDFRLHLCREGVQFPIVATEHDPIAGRTRQKYRN